MQKKIIIAGIILAIALGLLISSHIRLFGENYGTGLSLNTETRKATYYGHYAGKGKKYLYGDGDELMNRVYITSWLPDENSMEISFYGQFYFNQYYQYFVIAGSPIFFLGQYAWVVKYIDSNKKWHTIINGINGWYDRNIVTELHGQIGGNLPNMIYRKISDWTIVGKYAQPHNIWGDNTWTCFVDDFARGTSKWHLIQTAPLSFKIKGNKIGGIVIDLYIEVAELDCPISGCRWVAYSVGYIVHDEAYLASGIGKVDVLGVNALRQEGNVTTIPTGREVPLYVFEEGSEVIFEVDTGYAGAVTGEKGWRLAVYKADRPEPLAVWWLDDDLRNYEVRWKIPEGTFTPGGNNRMTVVLTNTIIDQAERTFFVVDKIEYCPGPTTIIPDKEKYVKGDEAHVTLRADANPKTKARIVKFYFEAKYGSEYSTDYAIKTYVPATHVGGLTYEGKVRFIITKGDKKLYMQAHAIDELGRPGDAGKYMVETETGYGNYKLTIYVQEPDGTPIKNAEVRVDNLPPRYTDDEGKVIFWVKYGSHHYKVHKSGYYDAEGDVEVVGQMKIVVTLRPKWQPPEMNLLAILSAVAIIGFGIFIGMKIYKERKKYGKK